ncbi:hypothetical protein [Streptomyces sp. NPDC058861]|uniref:hypothetical protein n=1 Tax=Streptomyces sp. NPDC058861 TaxID=3346653 RepID=UPI0036A35DB0
MSFDKQSGDRFGDHGPDASEVAPRWRRVSLPVPPVSKLVKGGHFTSRLGTVAGSGLGVWIATGHTQGDVTWATVAVALAAIAADTVRKRGCVC